MTATLTDRPGALLTEVPAHLIIAGRNDRQTFSREGLAELAASIEAHGLAQPPTFRPVGARFEIVAGERRTRAMRDILGWETIPALIREMDDSTASAVMLAENVQRVDLDPVEEARAYASRLEGRTVAEVARMASVPADRVRRRVALLALSPAILPYVSTRQLPLSYASAMVDLDPNRQQLALAAYQTGRLDLEEFRTLCGRLMAEQSAESMFDTADFLRVEEYVVDSKAVDICEESPYTLDVSEAQPVGIREIAALLGVKRSTVDQWKIRKILPPPRWMVSGNPAWNRDDIEEWAKETGRWHGEED